MAVATVTILLWPFTQLPEEIPPSTQPSIATLTPPSMITIDGTVSFESEAQPDPDRPLFSPSRRPIPFNVPQPIDEPEIIETPPVQQEDPPIVNVTPDPPLVQLVGAMRSELSWVALVRDPTSGSERWAKVGEEIDGWRLRRVDANQIELTHGDDTLVLRLYE